MIYDITSGSILAREPYFARSFGDRLRGMIGRDFSKTPFDAMIFEGCSAVHSCWMSCAIDVIFADRSGRICRIFHSLPPWRLASGGSGASLVIELPAGVLQAVGAAVGDQLDLYRRNEGAGNGISS